MDAEWKSYFIGFLSGMIVMKAFVFYWISPPASTQDDEWEG